MKGPASSGHESFEPVHSATLDIRDFDAVYRAHVDQVARWTARLAGPGYDVEDLVQEVFLVVHRRLDQFRGDARITTWLYRIAERVVMHRRRVDRRRRWMRQLFGAPGEDDTETVGAELERRQTAALVYRVLDALPEKYRRVLVLFEIEGLPGERVAELTGLKLATVWVQLHRARALFRDRLAELPEDAQQAVNVVGFQRERG